MIHTFVQWLLQFGYAGIFGVLMLGIIGIPFPDEWILMFAGSQVYYGHFSYPVTVVVAAAGAMCGISVSYLLGRTAGLGVVHKFGRFLHVDQARLDRAHRWFDRVGKWALPLGYFVPGVRHFTAIAAGVSEMGFGEFALFAYGGATVWVTIFVTMGYWVGERWEKTSHEAHRYLLALGGAVVLAAGAAALFLYIRRRYKVRQTPPPGA